MNNIIEYIYNHAKDVVLKDVPNKEQMEKFYQQYLIKRYASIDGVSVKEDLKKVIFTESEIKFWKNKSLIEKQQILIKDDAYEQLKRLSMIGFMMAKEKLYNQFSIALENNNFNDQNIDENILNMEKYYNQVQEYNKIAAMNLLSEGDLDYNYVKNNTDIMSIRLGHLYNEISNLKTK